MTGPGTPAVPWSPAVTLRVFAALNPTTTSIWDGDGFNWDAGQWAAAPYASALTEITAWVSGITIERGRDDALGRYRAGTLTLTLDNQTGIFTPWGTLDYWGAPDERLIRPGLAVWVTATTGFATYSLYKGYLDTVTERTDGFVSLVEFAATDATKYLAALDRTPGPAQGAGEGPWARLRRILAAAGWLDWWGDLGESGDYSGDPPLAATTLAGRALDEVQAVADASGGDLYMTGTGTLFYRPHAQAAADRIANLIDPSSLTTFTDAPVGAGEIGYSGLEVEVDDAPVRNEATIAGATGREITARDGWSVSRLGALTFRQTGLPHLDDAWSRTLAQWLVTQWAVDPARVTGLTVSMDRTTPGAVLDPVLGVELSRYVRVRRRWRDQVLDAVYRVEGIAHTLDRWTWTTTLKLWPAGGI